METLSRTPHLKLQEMCDCYLETNFTKQLKAMGASKSKDFEEDGFKYLALALLEATTEQARKLLFEKVGDSITVTVKMVDRIIQLPSPAPKVMDAVTTIFRDIIHLDEEKGKSPLILGLRNGQLDLRVEMERDGKEEHITIRFPEVESKITPSRVAVAPSEGKNAGDLTHWKCGQCNFTFTAPSLPEQCPGCGEKCDFLNVTCYTPDCGGPGNIDPRLV
jgi:rubrerythrin